MQNVNIKLEYLKYILESTFAFLEALYWSMFFPANSTSYISWQNQFEDFEDEIYYEAINNTYDVTNIYNIYGH